MLAITAVITAGLRFIKAKGRMGIREATVNDNPVSIAALIGGQDSSDVCVVCLVWLFSIYKTITCQLVVFLEVLLLVPPISTFYRMILPISKHPK